MPNSLVAGSRGYAGDTNGQSCGTVSIAVTPTGASIASGTTEAFSATGTYSDGTTQTLTSSVTWTPPHFREVELPPLLEPPRQGGEGTAAGQVTITATSGTISGSTPLTVTAPVLTSIVVTSTAPAVPRRQALRPCLLFIRVRRSSSMRWGRSPIPRFRTSPTRWPGVREMPRWLRFALPVRTSAWRPALARARLQ